MPLAVWNSVRVLWSTGHAPPTEPALATPLASNQCVPAVRSCLLAYPGECSRKDHTDRRAPPSLALNLKTPPRLSDEAADHG